MLQQIGPDLSIITETFERKKNPLSNIIKSKEFKYFSYFRQNRAPGGGCAIVFNENRFSVKNLEIQAIDEIETCWALVVPDKSQKVKTKRLAVGAYYISPRSKYKQQVVEHIIDTIHLIRAKYSNEVNFIIAGDFNRVNTADILDSYGALRSVVSVPTRKSATLEVILTDLYTQYHPPSHHCRLMKAARARMVITISWCLHHVVINSLKWKEKRESFIHGPCQNLKYYYLSNQL